MICRPMTTTYNTNYQHRLEEIISGLDTRPRLLLHSCCAPCSSYCLTYLLPHFDVDCYFYNPNITDKEEYDLRLQQMYILVDELHKLLRDTGLHPSDQRIRIIEGDYEPEVFIKRTEDEGLTSEPEGGSRCSMCFTMRLTKTYELASKEGYDYFATTLTISPHKNAQLINSIGYLIGGDMWLPGDFKKNDGYKRSTELSKQFGLYRQNYCGCSYSQHQ
ncbi:MAG: epoxyqueuosine reductase QueH [Lachnospiraceae bacterium]|nr:epoxyqueuosine reductase QueH [Lachnospiraceae bacterium]